MAEHKHTRTHCNFVKKDKTKSFLTKRKKLKKKITKKSSVYQRKYYSDSRNQKPNPKSELFRNSRHKQNTMKSRTKQVTSALSPTSMGPANAAYPSINSAYWSAPSSNHQPYVIPGLCCTYVKNKNEKNRTKTKQNTFSHFSPFDLMIFPLFLFLICLSCLSFLLVD